MLNSLILFISVIIYPTDLDIEMEPAEKMISLKFPEPDMAVIIKVVKQ